MARPARAELDLQALRHNVALARQLAPTSRLMAVVKANAYGHGALTIAGALGESVDALAVACLEEALELRAGDISAPILLLQGVFSADELQTAQQQDIWVTVANVQQLQWLIEAELDKPLGCWLKIDTGMHRLGIPCAEAQACYQRLADSPNVQQDTVLYTHLASADEPGNAQTARQLSEFNSIAISCQRSVANSAGLLAWPESHHDWVRPGFMLYGNSPLLTDHPNARELRSVMTLKSEVIALRDVSAGEAVGYGASWTAPENSRIATVAIGYGDGYPQRAPNGTPVLVNGHRARLAGRVSMDMITVDVTGIAGVAVGDEVVLWGTDLPLAEIARHTDSLAYELTTRMPARTRRIVTHS